MSGGRPIAQITRELLAAPSPVIRHRVESPAGAVIQHRFIDVSKAVLDPPEGGTFQWPPALLPPLFSPVVPFCARFAHSPTLRSSDHSANEYLAETRNSHFDDDGSGRSADFSPQQARTAQKRL